MLKSDLVRKVAKTRGESEALVKDVVDAFIDEISACLNRHEPVVVREFGKFTPKLRSPGRQKGCGMMEGKTFKEKLRVSFTPSPVLMEEVRSRRRVKAILEAAARKEFGENH